MPDEQRKYHEAQCGTDCREDLLEKLGNCITTSGVWKFIGVLVTVLIFTAGLAMSIHADSQAKIEQRLEENIAKGNKRDIVVAEIQVTLKSLEVGQAALNTKLDALKDAIIKEVKKNR